MLEVLGPEKYAFFFDKFLEYFFTEDDAKFFASLGLNCIRLPFNYRHFEDDMNPRVLKKEGFKHLDRVIDLVHSTQLPIGYILTPLFPSAPNTISTQSWTCTLCLVVKTQTGILTRALLKHSSGIISISRIAPSGCGRKSPNIIVPTHG